MHLEPLNGFKQRSTYGGCLKGSDTTERLNNKRWVYAFTETLWPMCGKQTGFQRLRALCLGKTSEPEDRGPVRVRQLKLRKTEVRVSVAEGRRQVLPGRCSVTSPARSNYPTEWQRQGPPRNLHYRRSGSSEPPHADSVSSFGVPKRCVPQCPSTTKAVGWVRFWLHSSPQPRPHLPNPSSVSPDAGTGPLTSSATAILPR